MDEEIWDFDCTGSVMRFDDKELKLNEQLTEVLDDRMGQRHVLAFADDIKTEERYLVKIRYELNPKYFDFEDPEEEREIAIDHFSCEVDAAQRLSDAGYGPKYVAHWGQFQGSGWPFYGGAVFFLVMGTVPGEDVNEIRDELSDRQLDSIRSQLARILELMRTNGYKLYEQHPSFLRYDKVADKLYLVDLTFIGFTDPNSETSIPVTEDNVYVEAFNIWRYPYEEPPQAPRPPLSGDEIALFSTFSVSVHDYTR
ncbi:hypothetical protein BDV37DRAFT_272842 [Aspergillus pseudonomiae]|uniref:Protein kinase domain-containing protein n=1 Tax=Aspergillus pseudonomiae TaxID=1506151 RepID=A0A5N7D7Z9_9EURO|nr:uncharacterized protein BDV37DRAFT_272842 [Aspergillus pseudonomiae]KAE8402541.1 hypothetical protein BDV37DRAFT_272842 [Aspergillus pseudonomiae]